MREGGRKERRSSRRKGSCEVLQTFSDNKRMETKTIESAGQRAEVEEGDVIQELSITSSG